MNADHEEDSVMDHSELEPIEFEDNNFLRQILADEDEKVEDQFANFQVLANKECVIFPKNKSFCVIRFGENYKDRALAITDVVHTEQDNDSDATSSNVNRIDWGAIGYFNCKRIETSEFNGVKWLATLVWTGCRKPSGSSCIADSEWNKLLNKYSELGYDLDITLQKPEHITIRSIAKELTSSSSSTSIDNSNSGNGHGEYNGNKKANDLENIDLE